MDPAWKSVMTYDNGQHANLVLSSSPVTGQEENDNRDGNGSNSEAKLGVLEVPAHDDHDELHGEAEKEEKIELEQGNKDLSSSAVEP